MFVLHQTSLIDDCALYENITELYKKGKHRKGFTATVNFIECERIFLNNRQGNTSSIVISNNLKKKTNNLGNK